MTKKIKKYLHLLKSILTQSFQIKKLEKISPLTTPFIQAFLKTKEGFYTKQEKEIFNILENYRLDLLSSKEIISYEFFNSNLRRSVSDISKKASTPRIWCDFLFFLTKYYEAKNVLEIGTNLGVSGQYYLEVLKSKPNSKFITLEGIPRLCEISTQHFLSLSSQDKFEVIQGDFKETLPNVIDKKIKFDIVFIDGNHQYDATIAYYKALKESYNDNALIIFDDIYWSSDMEKAWHEIKKDDNTVCAIDLFKAGVVIFNKNHSAETILADFFLSIH